MKVVVFNGSPRPNGNTQSLVQSFIKGAKDKGHEVRLLRAYDLNVSPCKGCNVCTKNGGECVQLDDMQEVYSELSDAEVICVATPLYFYGISGKLKCIIDRLHNPIRDSFKTQKLVLLSCGGSSKPHIFDPLKAQFEVVCNYFSLQNGGMVTAFGARDSGVGEQYLLEAYEVGKNL